MLSGFTLSWPVLGPPTDPQNVAPVRVPNRDYARGLNKGPPRLLRGPHCGAHPTTEAHRAAPGCRQKKRTNTPPQAAPTPDTPSGNRTLEYDGPVPPPIGSPGKPITPDRRAAGEGGIFQPCLTLGSSDPRIREGGIFDPA